MKPKVITRRMKNGKIKRYKYDKINVNAYMESARHAELERIAETYGVTVARHVKDILYGYLDKYKEDNS